MILKLIQKKYSLYKRTEKDEMVASKNMVRLKHFKEIFKEVECDLQFKSLNYSERSVVSSV